MKKIRIKIDDEFKNEFKKLQDLLNDLNVNCTVERKERESMSGAKYHDEYLEIFYDNTLQKK